MASVVLIPRRSWEGCSRKKVNTPFFVRWNAFQSLEVRLNYNNGRFGMMSRASREVLLVLLLMARRQRSQGTSPLWGRKEFPCAYLHPTESPCRTLTSDSSFGTMCVCVKLTSCVSSSVSLPLHEMFLITKYVLDMMIMICLTVATKIITGLLTFFLFFSSMPSHELRDQHWIERNKSRRRGVGHPVMIHNHLRFSLSLSLSVWSLKCSLSTLRDLSDHLSFTPSRAFAVPISLSKFHCFMHRQKLICYGFGSKFNRGRSARWTVNSRNECFINVMAKDRMEFLLHLKSKRHSDGFTNRSVWKSQGKQIIERGNCFDHLSRY